MRSFAMVIAACAVLVSLPQPAHSSLIYTYNTQSGSETDPIKMLSGGGAIRSHQVGEETTGNDEDSTYPLLRAVANDWSVTLSSPPANFDIRSPLTEVPMKQTSGTPDLSAPPVQINSNVHEGGTDASANEDADISGRAYRNDLLTHVDDGPDVALFRESWSSSSAPTIDPSPWDGSVYLMFVCGILLLAAFRRN